MDRLLDFIKRVGPLTFAIGVFMAVCIVLGAPDGPQRVVRALVIIFLFGGGIAALGRPKSGDDNAKQVLEKAPHDERLRALGVPPLLPTQDEQEIERRVAEIKRELAAYQSSRS